MSMSSLDGATGLLPLPLADEEEAEGAAAADDGGDDDDAAASTGTELPLLVLSLVLPGSLSLSGSVSGSDGPPEPPSDLGENPPPPPPPFLPLPLLLPPPLLPPSLLPCSRLRAVGVRGEPEPLSSSEDVAPKPNTPPPGFGQRFVGMHR
jgi:hypothetical protein